MSTLFILAASVVQLAAPSAEAACTPPACIPYHTEQYTASSPTTPRTVPDDPGSTTDNDANDLLYDTFTDRAGVAIRKHRSSWGQPWAVVGETPPASSVNIAVDPNNASNTVAQISGGRHTVSAPTGWVQLMNHYSLYAPAGNADIDIWATVTPTEDANGGTRLLFGMNDDGTSYYDVELVPSQSKINLASTTADGTRTVAATKTDVPFPSGGAPVRVHFKGTPSLSYGGNWFHIDATVDIFNADGSGIPGWLTWTTADEVPAQIVQVPWSSAFFYQTNVGFQGPAGARIDDYELVEPRTAQIMTPNDGLAPGVNTRPAVVLVHGGSFASENDLIMADWEQTFAKRGYTAMSVNYRKLWQGPFTTRFAANSHRITLGAAPADVRLTVDLDGSGGGSDVTTVDFNTGSSLTSIQATFDAALGAPSGGGVDAEIWSPEAGTLWITWSGPDRTSRPYPKLRYGTPGGSMTDEVVATYVEGGGSNYVYQPTSTFSAQAFENLDQQLNGTPDCSGHNPGCLGHKRLVDQKCAFDHPAAVGVAPSYPPDNDGVGTDADMCDRGFQLWANQTVRASLDDVQSAIRWLKVNAATYHVDTSKIFITGESAGGILALEAAVRPVDSTGGAEDPNGPNRFVGGNTYDATVAGSAPFAAAWLLNGTGAPNTAPTPPIAIIQRDRDEQNWGGAMQGFTRNVMTTGWATSPRSRVEYHGWCGYGHGVAYGELPYNHPGKSTTSQEYRDFTTVADDVSRFFHTVLDPASPFGSASGVGAADAGTWTWNAASNTFIPRPKQQPVLPADGALQANGKGYQTIAGDFDGDGLDDVYFAHPNHECDAVYLGRPDGTLNPAPTMNPTDPFALSSGGGSGNTLNAITDDGSTQVPADAQGLVGDFDHNGRDDIAWWSPTSTILTIWATRATAAPFVAPTGEQAVDGPGEYFVSTDVDLGSRFSRALVGNFGTGSWGGAGTDLYLLDRTTVPAPNPHGVATGDDAVLYCGASATASAPACHLASIGVGFVPNGSTPVQPVVGDFDYDAGHFDDIYWYTPGATPSGASEDAFWYGNANEGQTGGSDGIAAPKGIAVVGSDAWFTNTDEDSIGRVTATGVITHYTHAGIDGPTGITNGPDGALWFTNTTGNSIGRITTDGTVTTYTDPSISGPTGITKGPDGALWFTNTAGNSIGRITTNGVVSSFTGAGISGPTDIASVTINNVSRLWFTNQSGNSVGRMEPSGANVTVFPNATLAGPTALVASGSYLWVANSNGTGVVRVLASTSSTPTFTAYPSNSIRGATDLALAANGDLWFANTIDDSIGRRTSAGVTFNYTGSFSRFDFKMDYQYSTVLAGNFGNRPAVNTTGGTPGPADLYFSELTNVPGYNGTDWLYYGTTTRGSTSSYSLWAGWTPGGSAVHAVVGNFDGSGGYDDIIWYDEAAATGSTPKDKVFLGRSNVEQDPWGTTAFSTYDTDRQGGAIPVAGNFDGTAGQEIHWLG